MDDDLERIERELTLLVRRAQKVHLQVGTGSWPLDRAAYTILGRLYDDGPLRLGALAEIFGVDPSTITRQADGLEQAGLVRRASDPLDRRASLLELTEPGRTALRRTRDRRRAVIRQLLGTWPAEDRATFADLLARLNAELSCLPAEMTVGAGEAGR